MCKEIKELNVIFSKCGKLSFNKRKTALGLRFEKAKRTWVLARRSGLEPFSFPSLTQQGSFICCSCLSRICYHDQNAERLYAYWSRPWLLANLSCFCGIWRLLWRQMCLHSYFSKGFFYSFFTLPFPFTFFFLCYAEPGNFLWSFHISLIVTVCLGRLHHSRKFHQCQNGC